MTYLGMQSIFARGLAIIALIIIMNAWGPIDSIASEKSIPLTPALLLLKQHGQPNHLGAAVSPGPALECSMDLFSGQSFLTWLGNAASKSKTSCAIVIIAFIVLVFMNRRLKKSIMARTSELERNRESLRQVLDLVPNLVYAKNGEGKFLLVNRAMADSLGTTTEELTGRLHRDIHPDRLQVEKMLADDKVVFDTGFPKVTLEEPCKYSDGSMHWLQTTRLPYLSAETKESAVLVLSVDITNRKLADDALKKSEEKFRAIFNQTYQFTAILDTDGTVTHVNQASLEEFGTTHSEVIGQKFWDTDWWDKSEKSIAWVKDAINRSAQGETVLGEIKHKHPDGSLIYIDFSIKPALNEEGKIIFLIPEGHNITSLKKTEDELEERVEERTRELEKSLEQLQEAQKELILSEKLAALGGLVAGVAHEINTPLGIGVTASSFLEEKLKELSTKYENDELKRSELEKFIRIGMESSYNILTNLNRAAELVKSFKQVAADQSSEIPRQFNLKHYVDEVLMSLRPKYKRTRHTIRNECPDVDMFSFPGAFMQIITNLLVNSLTHAFGDDDEGIITIGGTVKEHELKFTFSDNGAGISPELSCRIFEPFCTSRRGKGGTGLGLHIVFNTVTQALNGTIRFDSSPNKGTTFTITMPFSEKGSGPI